MKEDRNQAGLFGLSIGNFMKWKKLTIKTVTEAEDIIISDLYDIGLEGAMIEDHVPLSAWEKEQMFVDILPDGPEDDGIAYLSFFVEVPDEEKTETDSAADGSIQSRRQSGEAEEASAGGNRNEQMKAGLSENIDNSYF